MIHQSIGSAARPALLHPLVLLIVGLVSWPADWSGIHTLLDSARSSGPRIGDREAHAVGYYEEIIEGSTGAWPAGWDSELSPRFTNRPEGWIGFREADVVRYLDNDFLQFELKPRVRRTLFGQPFVTNSFGMHDGEVTLEKPGGTFRIAVLGASMDMGWGVRYQDTYADRFQDWLGAAGSGQGSIRARRFEVLNFAVAAYSPLQRLETLRRNVLAFCPDLVIYSATTLDVRLTEIHLCDMLRNGVDLRYGFLKQTLAEAGVTASDRRVDAQRRLIHKDRLKAKLRPYYWGLYDQTLGTLAAECRSVGVPLVMVIIPRVGKEDAPETRAEPVARLKALAAHHAITAFDLSNTFDNDDPAKLEIAAWDDHPNAAGHERLFLALAQAIAADASLSRLLFTPGTPGPQEIEPGRQAEADRKGATRTPPAAESLVHGVADRGDGQEPDETIAKGPGSRPRGYR